MKAFSNNGIWVYIFTFSHVKSSINASGFHPPSPATCGSGTKFSSFSWISFSTRMFSITWGSWISKFGWWSIISSLFWTASFWIWFSFSFAVASITIFAKSTSSSSTSSWFCSSTASFWSGFWSGTCGTPASPHIC